MPHRLIKIKAGMAHFVLANHGGPLIPTQDSMWLISPMLGLKSHSHMMAIATPVVTIVSQATRPLGSCAKMASRIPSEI